MNCPSCNKQVDVTHVYCPSCGMKIKEEPKQVENNNSTWEMDKTNKIISVCIVIFFLILIGGTFSSCMASPTFDQNDYDTDGDVDNQDFHWYMKDHSDDY